MGNFPHTTVSIMRLKTGMPSFEEEKNISYEKVSPRGRGGWSTHFHTSIFHKKLLFSSNECFFYNTFLSDPSPIIGNACQWLTHWLTNWLLFSKLDWCGPGMWRWQLKTVWGCYYCWCWWWETVYSVTFSIQFLKVVKCFSRLESNIVTFLQSWQVEV